MRGEDGVGAIGEDAFAEGAQELALGREDDDGVVGVAGEEETVSSAATLTPGVSCSVMPLGSCCQSWRQSRGRVGTGVAVVMGAPSSLAAY